jgi:aminoglycoside/choline kinase family phosphotransferase
MNSPAPAAEPSDPRAEAARGWALAQLGIASAEFAPASADASFRRYFRLTEGRVRDGARSWIVMDAPPEREDCRPFLAVARLLRGWGVNAPEIVGEDLARGFLLLSDLGTQTFLHALTADNADAPLVDNLYADAVDALVHVQARAQADAAAMAFLPAYDATLLWREARLFGEWYLPRHLGVALGGEEAGELERALGLLVKSALAQPRTFVHRDYMPRNLMVSRPNPGVLDFQDAVIGPISYDAVCLFKDAFLSWPAARVEGWLRGYWEKARAAQLPVPGAFAEFWRQAEWMGLQRHLKVLGIFARLSYRDGKAHYVADTPRFVRYVMEVAPRHAELAPLTRLFEKHVLPKVAQ